MLRTMLSAATAFQYDDSQAGDKNAGINRYAKRANETHERSDGERARQEE